MEINFKGKRALVTGAGQGIGRGVVAGLVKCGAEVVAVSKTQENLKSLKEQHPGVSTICVDLSDWDATKRALKEAGPIDLLVNNAGLTIIDHCLDVKVQDLDKVFDVNVKAVVNVSQEIARGMVERAKGGAIVNVSSVASGVAYKDHLMYCASKGALDQITRVMALELGPHKIRVNSVNPTVVMTAMGKMAWSDEAKAKAVLDRIPLGKFVEVDEVVRPILFLLSDQAAMINGTFMPIDGGLRTN